MKRPLPRLLMLAALAASLLVAGCFGGEKPEVRTEGHTEGVYLDVGELKYQVQISRILNPSDVEDRSYLLGVPAGSEPTAEETWFAVFVRVQNTNDDKTLPTATQFEIHDTNEQVFRPVEIDTDANPFAYEPGRLAPHGIVPHPDSAAGSNAIQGSLLLFKLSVETLGNRPLEFIIRSPENPDQIGTVDLDV